MNKGNQKKTVNKYCQYILELCEAHELHYPYHKINLKDSKLLEKYSISCYQYFIKKCLELGWIIDVGDYYKPKVKAKCYSLSIQFMIDNNLYSNISKYCNVVNNNNTLIANKVEIESVYSTVEIKEELVNSVRFGKVKIDDEYTDLEVLAALSMRYKQLPYYMMKAKDLNDILSGDLALKFTPTITRKNKRIDKIGIRCTSTFCTIPARKNHPENDPKVAYREDILDYWFGKDNWVEYDIKGSVPRISRLINCGEVEDLESDPYSKMYKSYFDKYEGGWDDDKRRMMKQYFMHLYFDGSIGDIVKHLNYTHNTKGYSLIKDPLTMLKDITEEYCGKTQGTEIFLHESCIYMDVLETLLYRRIQVVQVYDAFYMRKDELPNDMDTIVYKCMKDYVDKWI